MLAKNEKYCKVTEELLKLAYRVTKFSPTPTPDQHETLTHSLFALMSRFPTNPSILSHVLKLLSLSVWHAMSLKTGKSMELYGQVTNLIAEYSPMSHKEQVRIAVSKSLARLPPLLSEKDDALFPGQLKMLQALVLLLNDEQPDIRYYLCESEAMVKVIDHKGSGKWKVMEENVRLNDQVIVEYLFEEFTDRVETAQPHLASEYALEFLYKQWIVGNPYREHLSKNFEDKIFFFEPVNKFYDLLWVKRLAYKQLDQLLKSGVAVTLPTVEVTALDSRLTEYYSSVNILKHNSILLEGLVEDLIVEKLQGKAVTCPASAEQFVKSLF